MGKHSREVHLLVPVLLSFWIVAASSLVVTYDHRALLLDGQRRFLQSASIHYPRSTPQMWPALIDLAKKGGIDVIQTYVFWDVHEPVKETYDFTGRYDIVQFVKLVAVAGLYVNLRIGPYVCAEWNFGGFPFWLRDIPGIEFRTDNEPFKAEMERFTRKIVSLMKENNLFASQGGPIILAQIENEYGNIDSAYGDAAKSYITWAANMAQGLDTGVPWIMCQQEDAPANIINTCNGFYCDWFTPNAYNKPKMWTENWAGWFRNWGRKVPYRPVEDVAYAVALFFAKGGSFQNYYMYHGGTNFERSAGENIATSYDYDAPLDEYGQPREPKYSHLKELHAAIRACEPALAIVDGDPFDSSLGSTAEVHVYGNGEGTSLDQFVSSSKVCAAFLSNYGSTTSVNVQFNGGSYELPAWSVSVLPDCKNVVFNTAKVSSQTALKAMWQVAPLQGQQNLAVASAWEAWQEPASKWGGTTTNSGGFLEQLTLTKGTTDYLWHTTSVEVPENSGATIRLDGVKDTIHFFVNGAYAGSPADVSLYTVEQNITLNRGQNSISLLSMTLGLQNYGALLEKEVAGISGAKLVGLSTGDVDITYQQWEYQVGLKGEQLKLYTEDGSAGVIWKSGAALPLRLPLQWYKTIIDAPSGNGPVALDLGSMGKGQAWINGISIGRFWTIKQKPFPDSVTGCTDVCDYRGTYVYSKCTKGCGETARWYHVPRDWLKPTANLLVIFEETGGDPTGISLGTQVVEKVCAHVSASDPVTPSDNLNTSSYPRVHLDCGPGNVISQVNFASFGTPSGTCGRFQVGSCHASRSQEFLVKVRGSVRIFTDYCNLGPEAASVQFCDIPVPVSRTEPHSSATVIVGILSPDITEKECVGYQHCSIGVVWESFEAEDPCPGMVKSLAVEAGCAVSTLIT